MASENDAVLALCPPTYMSTRVANNQWMKDIPATPRQVDHPKAMRQWQQLYSLLAADVLVYLVPSKPQFQDQVYATNHGVVLPHTPRTFLLSNFKAEARDGEQYVAASFLKELGYECHTVPYFFEGEAELKWLREHIYFGGYGQRTSKKALDWIAEKYDAHIIPIEEGDPYLYHLDCSLLPLAKDLVIAYTDGMPTATVKEIEKYATIIPISRRLAYCGATNSLRVGYTLYNASCINEFPSKHPAFPSLKDEQAKNQFLQTVCKNYGLELVFVNLSEMLKSGALLSCCVLHLNYGQVDLTKP